MVWLVRLYLLSASYFDVSLNLIGYHNLIVANLIVLSLYGNLDVVLLTLRES